MLVSADWQRRDIFFKWPLFFPPHTLPVTFNASGDGYCTCFGFFWVFFFLVLHIVTAWQEERWRLHASRSTSVEASRDSLSVLGRSRLRRSSPVYRPARRVWTLTQWRAWGKALRCTHEHMLAAKSIRTCNIFLKHILHLLRSFSPFQFHFNPAQSVLVMESDDPESINAAMAKVSYINSRQFPTPGLRTLHVSTTIQWVHSYRKSETNTFSPMRIAHCNKVFTEGFSRFPVVQMFRGGLVHLHPRHKGSGDGAGAQRATDQHHRHRACHNTRICAPSPSWGGAFQRDSHYQHGHQERRDI